MKAVVQREHGGPDVLKYVDVPDPHPGPVDVIVEVSATALNRLDIAQRRGSYTTNAFRLPHIPGMDVAGIVVELGSEVDDVSIGDRVVVDPSLAGVDVRSAVGGRGDLYGGLNVIGGNVDGGYAQRCLVPASHVYRVPDQVSLEHAATFPTCHLTASHAIFDRGGLHAGERVLIHAAGSGVSVAAIQLAVAAGATVFATAGTDEKCERALEVGAFASCNNRSVDVAAWVRSLTDGDGVDMVFDHVGTALFDQSLFALGIRGRLVTCGGSSGDQATIPSLGYVYHQGISIIGSDAYRPEEFAPAWKRFCDGDFPVYISDTFGLEEAAEAHRRLEQHEAFGKILLTP